MTREEFLLKVKYIEEFASMSQDAYEKLEQLKDHDQAQREEITRLREVLTNVLVVEGGLNDNQFHVWCDVFDKAKAALAGKEEHGHADGDIRG